jgi:hypothetical protein
MKRSVIPIVMTVVLMTASCKSVNNHKKANETDSKEYVVGQDKGDLVFESFFGDKTMRLDYFHAGTDDEEHFSADRIVSDGTWSGSKKQLTDKMRFGLYFFEVVEKQSKAILYSKGFSSIFGEWQTTPEAAEKWGTFHESLRFPWPLKPVTVILQKRDSLNNFVTVWTTDIDPESRQVNPADIIHNHRVDIIAENGPVSQKVDLVILGDGYSQDEMEKFRSDAKRFSGYLMNAEPFSSHIKDFNIRAVETPGESSGVNRPHHGVFKRTALAVHYGIFDSERYALSFDNRTIRDIASEVPYDLMVILINERTYGGGGIYNLYSTVAADNKFSEYIMIHEMGHQMAALADEYYTSAVSYEASEVKVEPWEANLTALSDKNNLKWKDLLESETPLPTPWNKEEFDKFGYKIQKERDSLRAAMVPETVMEELFTHQMDQESNYFAKEKYREKVGAFEGAGYLAKGLFRPQIDCIMYTRHLKFCKVCRRSIEKVIDQNTY